MIFTPRAHSSARPNALDAVSRARSTHGQTGPLSSLPLAVLLNAPDFVRWPTPMFARLVHHCSRQQLRRIELADREAFKPSFMTTREAVNLRPPHVPELDIDAVRAALAEKKDHH